MTTWRLIIVAWTLAWALGLLVAVLVSEHRDAVRTRAAASARERVPDPVRCVVVPAPSVAGPRAFPRRGPASEPASAIAAVRDVDERRIRAASG